MHARKSLVELLQLPGVTLRLPQHYRESHNIHRGYPLAHFVAKVSVAKPINSGRCPIHLDCKQAFKRLLTADVRKPLNDNGKKELAKNPGLQLGEHYLHSKTKLVNNSWPQSPPARASIRPRTYAYTPPRSADKNAELHWVPLISLNLRPTSLDWWLEKLQTTAEMVNDVYDGFYTMDTKCT